MSLFPDPTTAEAVASVDHLRREAQQKAHLARKARDLGTAHFWLREMIRLDRVRREVVNASQLDMLAQPQEGSLL